MALGVPEMQLAGWSSDLCLYHRYRRPLPYRTVGVSRAIEQIFPSLAAFWSEHDADGRLFKFVKPKARAYLSQMAAAEPRGSS